MLNRINKFIFKNKTNKYLIMGGFSFFFIKGLIWLGVFIAIGLGITNSF